MKEKPKQFDRELPVALTTEEKAAKGLDLARLIKRRIDLVEEKRQFHAEMRDKFLKVDESIAELQNVVRTGKEQRRVRCELHPDYKANKVSVVRLDTGEVVETRAMKADERQQELELKKPETKEKDAA